MTTAIPPVFPAIVSTSPGCRPARISIPSVRIASTAAVAAPDRSRWAVEGREEPVPGGIDLDPSVSTEQRADHCVMALHQVFPRSIAGPGRALGRAHDVGEQDRREHPVERSLVLAQVLHEILDGLCHRLGVA